MSHIFAVRGLAHRKGESKMAGYPGSIKTGNRNPVEVKMD